MQEIRADKGIYSKEVLLKTAYVFTEQAYLHLSQDEKDWIISWHPKESAMDIAPESFENELISQELRAGLIGKMGDIRKLILARAFASTILEEEGEPNSDDGADQCVSDAEAEPVGDMADDPEGILKGWFDGRG